MTVLLNRPYSGYLSGSYANFDTSTEAALIAQGMASTAAVASTSTGPVIANTRSGIAAIPIGASSVVVTNNFVDPSSVIFACISQAAADGTLLRVERVLSAAGSFTIYGTANATAITLVKWAIVGYGGDSPTN